MSQHFCQSCAMPMDEASYGTNADKTPNTEYCKYCFQDGAFTSNETLEEAIESYAKYMADEPSANVTLEQAREQMRQILPKLKRWSA